MSPDTSILFSPIRIGQMELRNRLVMSPMENSFGTPDGKPTQRSIDYFEARAKGGVALITLGASSIDAQHKEVPNSLHFASDEHMMTLDRAKVAVNVGVSVARIKPEGVVLLLESSREKLVPADHVILAGQVEPGTRLFDELKDRLPDVHAIGDCTGLGLIRKATLEGAQVANAL
ncbi:MAG: hypothetical protein QF570_05795 [Myxococcota bacterium]|jgi:hypothetical protein|nr:hypothetical protein [Myxococcota bacterium]